MTLTIDEQAAAAIRPLLEPGETLLWAGRPRQGIVLRPLDVLFSLPILAGLASIAIFARMAINGAWELNHLQFLVSKIHFFLLAVSLPYFLYFLVGRHFIDRYYRSHLSYAVTDHRVITRGTARVARRSVSARLVQIPEARLHIHRNKRGTITFDSSFWSASGYDGLFYSKWFGLGFMHPALGRSRMFFQIENAETVYALITSPTK